MHWLYKKLSCDYFIFPDYFRIGRFRLVSSSNPFGSYAVFDKSGYYLGVEWRGSDLVDWAHYTFAGSFSRYFGVWFEVGLKLSNGEEYFLRNPERGRDFELLVYPTGVSGYIDGVRIIGVESYKFLNRGEDFSYFYPWSLQFGDMKTYFYVDAFNSVSFSLLGRGWNVRDEGVLFELAKMFSLNWDGFKDECFGWKFRRVVMGIASFFTGKEYDFKTGLLQAMRDIASFLGFSFSSSYTPLLCFYRSLLKFLRGDVEFSYFYTVDEINFLERLCGG